MNYTVSAFSTNKRPRNLLVTGLQSRVCVVALICHFKCVITYICYLHLNEYKNDILGSAKDQDWTTTMSMET
jgi:hypothetical protein